MDRGGEGSPGAEAGSPHPQAAAAREPGQHSQVSKPEGPARIPDRRAQAVPIRTGPHTRTPSPPAGSGAVWAAQGCRAPRSPFAAAAGGLASPHARPRGEQDGAGGTHTCRTPVAGAGPELGTHTHRRPRRDRQGGWLLGELAPGERPEQAPGRPRGGGEPGSRRPETRPTPALRRGARHGGSAGSGRGETTPWRVSGAGDTVSPSCPGSRTLIRPVPAGGRPLGCCPARS